MAIDGLSPLPKKKKILFHGLYSESHTYRNVLLCKDLKEFGRYNVTILVPKKFKFEKELIRYGIN